MSNLLFVTADAGGNVPPATGIAAELLRRGHRVRFLGHEAQRSAIEAVGGTGFEAYRHSPPWSPTDLPTNPLKQIPIMLAGFTSREMGNDLVDMVDRDPADVVIVDTLLLGVLDTAQRANLRTVSLVHSFFGFFDGPFYKGPMGMLPRFKRLDLRKLWRKADLVLVCSEQTLDPAGATQVPDNVVWAGAVQDGTARPADPSSKRVLVSFSTGNFPGQVGAYQNVLDGLAAMDVEVVVTTGPAVDPAELRAPANATVHRYFPHDELMADCAAVVGHGGHATTMRALSYDLPTLIMPMHPFIDQAMVGKAVAAAGAGLVLSKKSSPNKIRDAVHELLHSERHRAAARTVGRRLRDNPGSTTGADLLLNL